jgi:hypothetical protein
MELRMPNSKPPIAGAIASMTGGLENAELILQIIRDHIAAHPPTIEQLFPGKKLVDRPMTRKQITELAGRAAAKTHEERTRERYARIVPVIKELLAEDPHMALSEIAQALDARGIKPSKAQKWNTSSVLFIMKHAGIQRDGDRDQQKTP